MGNYASLEDIRHAIRDRRLIRFVPEGQTYVAEPHLLGHARRTGAFVLLAWTREPREGWQCFRYPSLRDLLPLEERFEGPPPGFHTVPHRLALADTAIRPIPVKIDGP